MNGGADCYHGDDRYGHQMVGDGGAHAHSELAHPSRMGQHKGARSALVRGSLSRGRADSGIQGICRVIFSSFIILYHHTCIINH